MADNFNLFQFGAKNSNLRDFYHRQIFYTATHNYFNSSERFDRIAANKDGRFNRDYRISSAGINAHMEDLISFSSFEFNRTSNDSIFMANWDSYHIVKMLRRSLWAEAK